MVACTIVRLVANILKCWWKMVWFRGTKSKESPKPVSPVAGFLHPVRMYHNHPEALSKWMHSAISPEDSTHAYAL